MEKQYRTIFKYLKSHHEWCWLTLLLIAEMVAFASLNTEPDNYYSQYVAETANRYNGLVAFIFGENLKASLYLILEGTIPFGFGVIWGVYFTVTGLVATLKQLLPEIGGWKIFLSIFPHGLLEIPAICFSILLSALWCRAVSAAIIRLFRRKPVLAPLFEDGTAILKSIVLIQVPLTLVAAILEVTASKWIACIVL